LLAYLMNPTEYKSLAPWCCLIGLLVACGTHILGAFLFPAMVVVTVATAARDLNVRSKFLRDWHRAALWCSPAFIGLATFYFWVSSNGVNRGVREPVLSNFAYVFYEFLGFGGLGPPRTELRDSHRLAVFTPYWPWLLIGLCATLGIGFLMLRTRPPRIVWYLAASLLVSVAVAREISVVENFQILGRHMAAIFPLFMMTSMLCLKPSISSNTARHGASVALVALGVAWTISDVRLIQVGQYSKDAYREAASIAAARSHYDGATILWAADAHAAHYYGILVMKNQHTVEIGNDDGLDWPIRNQAVDAINWSNGEATAYLDASTTPTLLVLSKPDLFDKGGAWRTLIGQRRPMEVARLAAFVLYEWPPQTISIRK
jgi:hypothetical protein